MNSQTQSPPFPPPPFPLWKDTPLHRLVLATLINEFSNRILTHHSSTATIENWLRESHILSPFI